MESARILDKYRGCLVGGAIGDALGYPVEFMNYPEIVKKYGPQGITEYEKIDGLARISDDTQMTLFTANGLLLGEARRDAGNIDRVQYIRYMRQCYLDWYSTQDSSFAYAPNMCWIKKFPELYVQRATGDRLLDTIQQGMYGTTEAPANESKGTGGLMRVAPVGLYFGGKLLSYRDNEVAAIGANTAALTHGHELGYIPAAVLTYIIRVTSHTTNNHLADVVHFAVADTKKMYRHSHYISRLITLLSKAIDFAYDRDMTEIEAIGQLGEGWVAEEALAIAIYCALKHQDDFELAVRAAVNHSGDSDSTGAIAGSILGAYLGMEAIPDKYMWNLELRDLILTLADDLYFLNTRDDEIAKKNWAERYVAYTNQP